MVGAVALVVVIAIAAIASSTAPTNDAATVAQPSSEGTTPDEPADPQPEQEASGEDAFVDEWYLYTRPLGLDDQTLLTVGLQICDRFDRGEDMLNLQLGVGRQLSPYGLGSQDVANIMTSAVTHICPEFSAVAFNQGEPDAADPPPSDDGPGYVDQSDLEADIRQQVEIETGRQNPNVSCPGELISEPGATLECEASFDGDGMFYPVTVEVDSLTGETVNYYITVGTPLPPGE